MAGATAQLSVVSRRKRPTVAAGREADASQVAPSAPAAIPATPPAATDNTERRATGGALTGYSARIVRASPIQPRRFRRSRSRQRDTRRRNGSGTAATSGGEVRTLAMVSETVSPAKARRPVSNSKRTAPKAQMSERWSTRAPRACSEVTGLIENTQLVDSWRAQKVQKA